MSQECHFDSIIHSQGKGAADGKVTNSFPHMVMAQGLKAGPGVLQDECPREGSWAEPWKMWSLLKCVGVFIHNTEYP